MTSPDPGRRLTRPKTTNFYYSFLFLPSEKRRAIDAVYAFARRGDDLVDGQLSPAEAQRGLNQYRADLEWCYRDSPAGDLPASPELPALASAVRRFHIPRQPFNDLICGLEMDLTKTRYETFNDLEIYCYRVASTIGLMAIEIFGYRNPSAKEYAVHLGKALQMVNILRDIRTDAQRGRVYLPLEDLNRFEVDAKTFLEGEPDRHFLDLVKFEAARAESFFELARRALAVEDRRTMVAAEIMAATYWSILGRIRNAGVGVLKRRVRLSRARKIWTALAVFCGAEWWRTSTRP